MAQTKRRKSSQKKTRSAAEEKTANNRSGRRELAQKKERHLAGEVVRDILFCLVLAVSVLLFLGNVGLAGGWGKAVAGFFKGLFGVMSYPLPLILFFGFSFYLANRDNGHIRSEIAGFIFLFLFLCAFMQLILDGYTAGTPVKAYYTAAADGYIAGGLFGGLIVTLFAWPFGIVGGYVLVICAIVICAILATQKPIMTILRRRSRKAMRTARARRQAVRERRKQEAEEARAERARKLSEIVEREKTHNDVPSPHPPVSFALKGDDSRPVRPVSNAAAAEKKASAQAVPEARTSYTIDDIPFEPVHTAEAPAAVEDWPSLGFGRDDLFGAEEKPSLEAPRRKRTRAVKSGDEKAAGSSVNKSTAKAAAEEDTAPADLSAEMSAEDTAPAASYRFPSTDLLTDMKSEKGDSEEHIREMAEKLEQTLRDFGVNVRVTNVSRGPAVTRYELLPEHGVKVSRIVALTDDIKLSLAAADIRIEAPIPGKSAVGIEVPNRENSIVPLREMLETKEYKEAKSKLSFALGRDIGGKPVIANIAKMPHVLIAGATGSGKSVCINTLIMGVLYKAKPEEVRMIMIDPKVIELSVYNGIPHLLLPVVTDPKKAAGALNWAVGEMTKRYEKFAKMGGVRDLAGYNAKVREMLADPDVPDEDKLTLRELPQILIIVDELADLMMVAPGEVEQSICRIAQLARACGMHLVVATQRPSVNVITGLIKANMPSRIAFAVTSGVDSRTILDMNGAERLLGKGDMLFYPQGYPKPVRVQGTFVSDEDVQRVVDFLAHENGETEYSDEIARDIENSAPDGGSLQVQSAPEDDRDEYFWEAGRFIIEKEKASIGMLQRMYKIGFNRAARIMDQLCEAGVVAEEEGTKPRRILMTLPEFEALRNAE